MATGQSQTAAETGSSTLEQVLRRDRAIIVVAILIIAAIAWAYTVYLSETGMGMGSMQMESDAGAGSSMGMGGTEGESDAGMGSSGMSMAMADMRSWSGADFGLMFVMWAVMMVAMMAPSATPMLLMFATLNRKRRENAKRPTCPRACFWRDTSSCGPPSPWRRPEATGDCTRRRCCPQ